MWTLAADVVLDPPPRSARAAPAAVCVRGSEGQSEESARRSRDPTGASPRGSAGTARIRAVRRRTDTQAPVGDVPTPDVGD